MNEDEIVARLRELFSDRIGDDAAVLDGQVVTTDMLVEDVDFTRAIDPRFIARKSLAVNLSDLAAMGATPAWAVVALAIPEWLLAGLDEFFDALAEASREHHIEIVESFDPADFQPGTVNKLRLSMVGNGIGGFTAYTYIYFIKNHCGQGRFFCNDIFYGKHQPGKLSSAGYLLKLFRLYATVCAE